MPSSPTAACECPSRATGRFADRLQRLLCLVVLVGALASPLSAQERSADGTGKAAEKSAGATIAKEEEIYELLELFVDTLDQVDRNYVKNLSRRDLMEAAIRGMLKELDQYSNYIPPKELESFRRGVESEFGGIGIRVSIEDGVPTIASPLVGGPAYRAGIAAGDQILKVDGKLTRGVSTVAEVAKLIKGKVGAEVTLTVKRKADEIVSDVKLKREIVRLETVLGDRRTDDDKWDFMFDEGRRIGYLRITSFSRHTVEEMQRAMAELKKRDLAALVLDLRGNPGGLLSGAIQIADLFLEEGVIVSTKGRNYDPVVRKARRRGTYAGFPIAILVNRFTASASEIVAACLQDHQRAVVIGQRTWGKGSVQNIIELEGGRSAVKLTTASYFRPSGVNIHRQPDASEDEPWGVKPNDGMEVLLNQEQNLERLRKRRDNDLLKRDKSGKLVHVPHVDLQLQRALEYLKETLAKPEVPVKEKAEAPGKEKAVESLNEAPKEPATSKSGS